MEGAATVGEDGHEHPLDSHLMLATCPLENQQHPTLVATLHAMSLDTTRHQTDSTSLAQHRHLHGPESKQSRWGLLPAHFRKQLEKKALQLRAQLKPSSEDTIDQSNRVTYEFERKDDDALVDHRLRWSPLRDVDPSRMIASSQPVKQKNIGELHLHRRQSHDATAAGFRSSPSSPLLKTGCARGSSSAGRQRHAGQALPLEKKASDDMNIGEYRKHQPSASIVANISDVMDDETMVESRRTSGILYDGNVSTTYAYMVSDTLNKGKGVSSFRRARSVTDIQPKTPPRIPRTMRINSDFGAGRHSMSSPIEGGGGSQSDSTESLSSAKVSLFDLLTRKAGTTNDMHSPGSVKSEGDGIAWSSSLETPPRAKTTGVMAVVTSTTTNMNGGDFDALSPRPAMKTPVKNMLVRTGEPPSSTGTLSLEDEAEGGDVIEWSSTLETPPKKKTSPNKRAADAPITPSRRKAKMIDRLRGVPSKSPSAQERQRWIELQSGATSGAPSSSMNNASEYAGAVTSLMDDVVREWSPVIDGSDEDDGDHTTIVDIDLRMHEPDIDPSTSSMSLPRPPTMPVTAGCELTLPSSFLEDLDHSLPTDVSPKSVRTISPSHGIPFDHTMFDASSAVASAADSDNHEPEPSSQDRRIMARYNNTSEPSTGFQSLTGKTFAVSKQALQNAQRLFQQDDDADANSAQQLDELHMQAARNDPLSEDEFSNLRISQLDDGLTMLSDSTQGGGGRSSQSQHQNQQQQHQSILSPGSRMTISLGRRKSFGKNLMSQRSGQPGGGDHDDDTVWLSNNAHLLGDFDHLDDSVEYSGGGDGNGAIGSSKAFSTAMKVDANDSSQVLGGFSTGKGKPLKPISNEAMDRWSKLFDDDLDGTAPPSGPLRLSTNTHSSVTMAPPPGVSGFVTGGGKKVGGLSEDKLQKWANFFEDDVDGVTAATTGFEMRQSFAPPTAAIPGFRGFSTGSGKKHLQPVSREAQERARQLLEMDDDLTSTTSSSSSSARTSTTTTSCEAVGFGRPSMGAGGNTKHGLRTKTLGGISGSSVPRQASGIASLRRTMGPASKLGVTAANSKMVPMKTKLPFKPPTMTDSGSSSASATKVKPLIESAAITTAATAGIQDGSDISAHQPVFSQQPAHRRTTSTHRILHPNAKPQIDLMLSSTGKPALDAAQPQQPSKPAPPAVFDMTPKEPRKPFSSMFSNPLALDREELLLLNMHQDIVDMTLDRARTYQFSDTWGIDNAMHEMLTCHEGVQEQHLSRAWVANHYALIVWKLACYVRSWPTDFQDWFCPSKVVEQLLYRYEREINRAERPALRKIVEGDESSQRHMVLCIADVQWQDLDSNAQDGSSALATMTTGGTGGSFAQKLAHVKVTDGWYVLPASVDLVLHRALERGKLRIGSKIGICRAKLEGVEGGIGILEVSDDTNVALRLQGNNTRLVSWDTKLGFQKSSLLWWTKLRNILPQGGMVPGIDVVVLRKYPVLFLESMPDGTWVRRTRHEEDQASERHQEALQRQLQDYAQQLEKEQENSGRMQEREALEGLFAQKAQELRSDRQVKPMFMLRVVTFTTEAEKHDIRQGLLTFWNDSHEAYEEGHRYRITSMIAKRGNGYNNGGSNNQNSLDSVVHLTADRSTTSQPMPADSEAVALSGYEPRIVTLIDNIGHGFSRADELDIAVVVLAHGPLTTPSSKPFVIVTDVTRRLLLVECPPSTSNGKLPHWMKVNAKILLTSAKFKLWDTVLQVPVVSYVSGYSQITYGGIWTAPTHQHQSFEASNNGTRGKSQRPRGATATGQQPLSNTGTIIGGSRMSWPAFAQPAWEALDVLFEDHLRMLRSSSLPRQQQQQKSQQFQYGCEDPTSLSGLTAKANELIGKLAPDT